MDEEQNNTVNDTLNTENKGKNAAKSAKKGIKKGKSIIGKMKNIKLLAPLASILSSLGIIFLIIGFIGFFTTLPGLAVEKIIEWIEGFWDWVVASDEIEVESEDLVDLANYIQELGYGLVENGFVTKENVSYRRQWTGKRNKN